MCIAFNSVWPNTAPEYRQKLRIPRADRGDAADAAAHRHRDRRSHGFRQYRCRDFRRCAHQQATDVPVIIATRLPTKQMLIMDFQRARANLVQLFHKRDRPAPPPPVAAQIVKYFRLPLVVLVGNTGQQQKDNDYHCHQQRIQQRHLKCAAASLRAAKIPPASAVTTTRYMSSFFVCSAQPLYIPCIRCELRLTTTKRPAC